MLKYYHVKYIQQFVELQIIRDSFQYVQACIIIVYHITD